VLRVWSNSSWYVATLNQRSLSSKEVILPLLLAILILHEGQSSIYFCRNVDCRLDRAAKLKTGLCQYTISLSKRMPPSLRVSVCRGNVASSIVEFDDTKCIFPLPNSSHDEKISSLQVLGTVYTLHLSIELFSQYTCSPAMSSLINTFHQTSSKYPSHPKCLVQPPSTGIPSIFSPSPHPSPTKTTWSLIYHRTYMSPYIIVIAFPSLHVRATTNPNTNPVDAALCCRAQSLAMKTRPTTLTTLTMRMC
jgi:hypothetical protein